MDRIEELELKLARLEADVLWLKSKLNADKPVAYNKPGSNPCSEIILPSYREEQAELRSNGWDAYNSDYVDEFPTW
jgi:hypothetical protein